MAALQRQLDVWIVEINTVYRDVPFAVVTDWLQQGRLLGEDKVRPPGGKTWYAIDDVPALTPYVPRPEAEHVEDQAEALEPVALDMPMRRRADEEDEDVDMIPLIDISLVLLIFFMMTASVSSGFLSLIDTPAAKHQLATVAQDGYWIGIEPTSRSGVVEKDADGKALAWYSLGHESSELVAPVPSAAAIVEALSQRLAKDGGAIKVRLRADRKLPVETIRGITLDLQVLEARLNKDRPPGQERVQLHITGEVSELK